MVYFIVLLWQKIKGKDLADFLADDPLYNESEFKDNLPDEPVFLAGKIIRHTVDPDLHWVMCFDGDTWTNEFEEMVLGVGIISCSPERVYIPHSFSLLEHCSNNMAEYTALIMV